MAFSWSACSASPIFSSASPTSTFRTTLQPSMLKTSVMAIVDLHTKSVELAAARDAPAASRSVRKPSIPSLLARARTTTSNATASDRGPSSSSRTSSFASFRRTAELALNSACSSASPVAHRNGFSLGFRKGVPWLPFRVTQPLVPSLRARPRTRCTWVLASVSGPSTTSKSSPCSSFLMTPAPSTSKASVIATSRSHLQKSCRALAKPTLVTRPSCAISRNTRDTCSGVRSWSGRVLTKAAKWASLISPEPLETWSNTSSTLFPDFLAAALRAARAFWVAPLAACAWAARTASVAAPSLRSAPAAREPSFVSSTRASSRRLRLEPL
mmetsp:Transcript_63794/g.167051  ORF Transcript_63794/g.167051 Transcript_63794/m.167051 type:complete len:327 (-) Transcript_63794:3025-4005(-)